MEGSITAGRFVSTCLLRLASDLCCFIISLLDEEGSKM